MDVEQEIKRLRDQVDALERVVGRRADPILLADGCRKMVVTTQVPAMTGDTPGKGQAVEAVFDPSVPSLAQGTGTAEDVWSAQEKRFAVGAVIDVYTWQAVSWIFNVDQCQNYV